MVSHGEAALLPLSARQRAQPIALRSLAQTLALGPDRLSLFSFADAPTLRPQQRPVQVDELPTAVTFIGGKRLRPDDPACLAARAIAQAVTDGETRATDETLTSRTSAPALDPTEGPGRCFSLAGCAGWIEARG